MLSLEFWFLIIIGILLLGSLGYLIIHRRIKNSYASISNVLFERKDIENYIDSNLNQVTIISIKEHFNLSNRSLYEILKPLKPGQLIAQKRKLKADKLYNDGADNETIAKITGFSTSYLKKIIRKN